MQVRAGKLPSFRVNTQWNKDSGRTVCGHCSTGSTTLYDCWPHGADDGRAFTIGTQR